MALCQVLFCLLMVATLICPSHQEKTGSTNFRQRSTSLKKSTPPKSAVKTPKFKLDLKMEDSLPPLNYQKVASRSNTRDDDREYPRNSRGSSTVGTSWYGFDNYVPRKGRSSSHSSTNSQVSLGSTMRKSYVIGEGYMNNNNDHSNNQVAVRYHRQSEPELDFNLVIPQLEIDAHYRPKAQEQRQVYGNILDINKLGNIGNTYNSEKSEPSPYYQQNYNSMMRQAPIPVVIKIIPLKLSSSYLKEALRSMPFIPLPMSLFNALRDSMSFSGMDTSVEEAKGGRGGAQRNEGYTVRYDDTMPEMVLAREPISLPRPSSHVATPLDMPPPTSVAKGNLGVTYLEDDGSRFEYDNRFSKRISSTT